MLNNRVSLQSLAMSEPTAPVIIYGKQEASVSLYFDGLPADLRQFMQFLVPSSPEQERRILLGARLVIVVREFARLVSTGTIKALRRAGIPIVWFVDDDLVALGREEPAFRNYTPSSVRGFARNCMALVATTPSLARTLARVHSTIVLWPSVRDDAFMPAGPSKAAEKLHIGAFGGGFRSASLQGHVLPALAQLQHTRPTRLFAVTNLLSGASAGAATLPFEPDFRRFIPAWQALGLHVLVHAYGISGNIANKSSSSLLVSWYLGAVPIVGDEPAYVAVGEAEGVLKAAPDPASWHSALVRAADPVEGARLFARLTEWCRSACDPELARVPFSTLLQATASPPRRGLFARLSGWRK